MCNVRVDDRININSYYIVIVATRKHCFLKKWYRYFIIIIIIIIIIIAVIVSSVFNFIARSLSKITIAMYPQRMFFVSVHRWMNHLGKPYLKVRILKFFILF